MKIPFRQGVVRYQTDISQSPSFLYRETTGNYISLYVSPTSTIVTFAHGDVNYLIEESRTITNAWGPFTPGVDYWLYWDINIATGVRTFGTTPLIPIHSENKPPHPQNDQHWYDLHNSTMFYWNNTRWVECVRVFAGSYLQGANLTQYTSGSQVGDTHEVNAGFILFDDNEKPVRKARLDGKGKFLTTESHFYSDKAAVSTVSFETVMHYAQAREDLAAWNVVTYVDSDGLGLASNLDPDHKPAFGMLREGLPFGSIGSMITRGYVTNLAWNWTAPPSTILYLGAYGSLQVTPPGHGFIQQIATIVSPDTIFVNIEPQIVHYDAVQNSITIPVEVDLVTGKLTTAPHASSGGGGGQGVTIGMTHTQLIPSTQWIIPHDYHTTNFIVQIHDTNGDLVFPDNAVSTDANTVTLSMTYPMAGKAQLLLLKST